MAEQVVIAGMPPAPTPAEGNGQTQDTGEKSVADQVAEAMKPFQTQLETDKAEIAGLNRKVTEVATANEALTKEKEGLEKAASDKALTVEEQLAAMRTDLETGRREALKKEAEAAMLAKKLQWQTAATKLNIPPDTFVDPSLSVEDGEKYLASIRVAFDERMKVEMAAQLGAGWKPGTGNVEGGQAADTKNWTKEQWAEHYAEQTKARVVANPKPPGVT